MSSPTYKHFGHWSKKRHVVQLVVLLTFLFLPVPIPFVPGLEQGILRFDFDLWRIHFFGITLVPGLFHLFFLAFLIPLYLLAITSALYSKVFCGWVCPQNIFFEMFSGVQKRLKKRFPRFRKSPRLQNLCDLGLAMSWGLLIAWTATRYFIGASPIFTTFLFTLLFLFFVYDTHYLKHSFCQNACPYAFLQKSFQREHSLHVMWEDRAGNKCGTCRACEVACYVDLDIKKDTYHLDCTMCGACVDACESVYRNRPEPSLLRFAFQEAPNKGRLQRLGLNSRPKIFLVSSFAIFLIFFGWSVTHRPIGDFRIDYPVGGTANQLPYLEGGKETNLYSLRIRNMNDQRERYELTIVGNQYEVDWEESEPINAFETATTTLRVHRRHQNDSASSVSPISFQLRRKADGQLLGEQTLLFRSAAKK